MTENVNKVRSIKRRSFIKKASVAAVGVAVANKAPYVFSQKTPTLRVIGTHVTLQEEIRQKAMGDLGINIEFEPGGSATVLQKASTRPESFDLYEQWSNSINILWNANAIQSIDRSRIINWGEINDLTKTGRVAPDAKIGLGDAPYKLLYVQEDHTLSNNITNQISFLPYVHNMDSFGYNTNIIEEGTPYGTESWGWLLDERWAGKVGIINDPTIGLFDLALAAQARNLMSFKDMGNMSIAEIDELFSILLTFKQAGHFSGFWTSVPQSVEYITKQRVAIQSMFSPGATAANGLGTPVVFAAPREGYRAWHGVMCLSSKTEGYVKDIAYEYMNWWLSGWPGAFVARQGYYISNAERSRPLLSNAEWEYWYEGKPTPVDLLGTDGNIAVKPGYTRRGGSYTERLSNIAIWNTVMDNYDYSVDRWYEFLRA
jgi:putative spermidine/putrescine transport system substrate-binding protein